jgi:hypothetical protein
MVGGGGGWSLGLGPCLTSIQCSSFDTKGKALIHFRFFSWFCFLLVLKFWVIQKCVAVTLPFLVNRASVSKVCKPAMCVFACTRHSVEWLLFIAASDCK